MNIQDVIEALAAKGLGSRDFLTGETTVETAQLDEDINGDGGLTVSWRSTEGGVIPAGDMLLGYVMMTPYVPSTNDDGTYSWSPKWSEPSAILSKTPYGKMLKMTRSESCVHLAGVVVCVANLPEEFDTDVNDGDLAIENQPGSSVLYCWHADGTGWVDDGPMANYGDIWKNTKDNKLWEYINGEWTCDGEKSDLYTFAFAGNVRTIVEDMNTFLSNTLGSGWSVKLEEDEDDENHSLATTYIVCTFDGCDVKAAIEEIANAAAAAYEGDGAVNLYYVGKTIHLGLSHAFAADEYYNRFVVLGGTRNMAKRVPAGNAYAAITQRLHIPEGSYVKRANGNIEPCAPGYTPATGEELIMVEQGSVIDMRSDKDSMAAMTRFLVWDEIYPKLELTITETYCRLCYQLDENGDKISDGNNGYKLYCKWYIILSDGSGDYSIDNRYIIQDKPLSILFQSGPLTGREFEVVNFTQDNIRLEKDVDDVGDGYTPRVGELRIVIKADGDILLPTLPADDGQGHIYANGGLCPQVGNVVTLVNVAIEDSFKEAARMELLRKGWAMAKLISSGKQAAWDEKRTVPDFLTGEGGDVPGLGESIVGQEQSGYVVTGIETNLVSGEKQYSWGTFKPRGILSSSIDKIGSLSLSGGEATYAPLVSVSGSGDSQVIYVGNDYTDNGTSEGSSSSYTSQGASTAIRYAGGNTNIKTVYKSVNESKESDGFARLIRILWEHRSGLALDDQWSSTTVAFSKAEPSSYSYWCNGEVVKYQGVLVASDELFPAIYELVEAANRNSITVYLSKPNSGMSKYDLCAEEINFSFDPDGDGPSDAVSIKGGLRGSVFDGDKWNIVLESTTAIIENVGHAIELVVFGGIGNDINNMIEAAGMLTTQNTVNLFATSTLPNGTSLAEAVFSLGIKYRVSTLHHGVQGWHDVWYNYETMEWEFCDDNTPVASGDVEDIEPYSFSETRADIACLLASESFKLAVGNSASSLQLVMSTEGSADTFVLQSYWNGTVVDVLSFRRVTVGGDVKRILTLTSDNATIAADSIDFVGKTINLSAASSIGLNASQINFGDMTEGQKGALSMVTQRQVSGGTTFTLGYYDSTTPYTYNNLLTFDTTYKKLQLTTSNCTIQAAVISALADSAGLVIRKENGTGVGSTIEMGKFNGNTLLAGLKFVVGSEQQGGQTVETYTLDLTADRINLNANQLKWKGASGEYRDIIPGVAPSGEQYDVTRDSKFYVDDDGNVTMNNLTANNGTFTGSINATGGTITGDMVIAPNGGSVKITMTVETNGSDTYPVIKGGNGSTTLFKLGPTLTVPDSYDSASIIFGNTWLNEGRLTIRNSNYNSGDYARDTTIGAGTITLTKTKDNNSNETAVLILKVEDDYVKIGAGNSSWPAENNVQKGYIYVDGNHFLKVRT